MRYPEEGGFNASARFAPMFLLPEQGLEHAPPCPSKKERRFAAALAEREGFEPPLPFRVKRFSRPPHSTALPPLLNSTRQIPFVVRFPTPFMINGKLGKRRENTFGRDNMRSLPKWQPSVWNSWAPVQVKACQWWPVSARSAEVRIRGTNGYEHRSGSK